MTRDEPGARRAARHRHRRPRRAAGPRRAAHGARRRRPAARRARARPPARRARRGRRGVRGRLRAVRQRLPHAPRRGAARDRRRRRARPSSGPPSATCCGCSPSPRRCGASPPGCSSASASPPGIIGVQSVIGLLIITQYSMPLEDGLGRAGLVLLGGLVQVVLLLTAWPLRRSPVERSALAEVYRSLGGVRRRAARRASPSRPTSGRSPRPGGRCATRSRSCATSTRCCSPQLHDEAERRARRWPALALVRGRLVGWPARAPAVALLDELAGEAAALLRDIAAAAELPRSAARAAALTRGRPRAATRSAGQRLGRATAALRDEAAAAGPSDSHVGASLVGEVERLATGAARPARGGRPAVARRPPVRRPRAPARPPCGTPCRPCAPTSRCGRRSCATRCAWPARSASGTALAGLLPFEHRYWLPLTALVVLKPDFRSTFTRGLGPHPRHGRRGAARRRWSPRCCEPGPLRAGAARRRWPPGAATRSCSPTTRCSGCA